MGDFIIKAEHLEEMVLKNTNNYMTQGILEAITKSHSLRKLHLEGVKSYPGFEDFLAEMLFKKAEAKIPLLFLSLSKVQTIPLQAKCPLPILVTPEEESKGDHCFEGYRGFSLQLDEVSD